MEITQVPSRVMPLVGIELYTITMETTLSLQKYTNLDVL